MRASTGLLLGVVGVTIGGVGVALRNSSRPSLRVPASYVTERRLALEQRAVNVASTHWRSGGWVVRHTRGKPYDLVCSRYGARVYVEIKGSSQNARHVMVTARQVEHARKHHTALAVVSGIAVVDVGDTLARRGAPR